jgi:hypothetical protein
MPGGLIQLIAIGAQDYLLSGNPEISYFKKTYKTHTNFAMESMKVNFNRNYISFTEKTTLIANIPRNADLVQDIYFSFKIPTIKKRIIKNTENKIIGDDFRFVQNLGEVIIEKYYIYIGGTIIDTQYGEWLHIWNELSIESSKRYGYDKLIGNVPEIYIPDQFNRIKNQMNQIESTRLYTPLKFWFNRNPGLALPLISLQYHDIQIHVELRPYKQIFTVNKQPYNEYLNYFDDVHLDIEPYLEVNYVFLDTNERTQFATKSQDYLIEQVIQIPFFDVNTSDHSELTLQNPVKEIIWVLKRDDLSKYNSWFDYIDTNYSEKIEYINDDNECVCEYVTKEKEILKNAKFMLNGNERIEAKDASYFNLIQPYQHHTVVPKSGIYVYSFSMYPEQFQPSGSCNMSRINKIELITEISDIRRDQDYKYDMFVYVVNYNFLRITAGLGGLAFAC